MPGIRLSTLVRRLRDVPPGDGCSDVDLLARFARTRDDAAFELLVWRHGAMVLGACRRLLRHTEDAEDAFQATFLVLARKAPGVSRGGALPAWLHRVAVRIAARLARSRRAVAPIEVEPPARPEPDPVERADGLAVLDQEIDRLPDRCRRAVILCYLEGLTAAEAARQLGCPTGTIESRLAAARKRLRDRLTRRGVALPAGVLAVLTGPTGSLAPAAVARLARAAAAFARGDAGTAEFVNEPSVRLAKGVLTMWGTRAWAAGLAIVAAVALLTAGVGWANRNPPADPPGQPAVAAADLPAAANEEPPIDPPAPGEPWPLARVLQLGQEGTLVGISGDGRHLILRGRSAVTVYDLTRDQSHQINSPNTISDVALSPDGKLLATAEGTNGVKLRELATRKLVDALWPSAGLPAHQVAFSPDSSRLIALCWRYDTPARPQPKGDFGAFGPGGPGGLGGPGGGRAEKVTLQAQVSVWDLAAKKELGRPAESVDGLSDALPRVQFAAGGRFVLKTEDLRKPGNPEGGYRLSLTDPLTGTAGKPFEVRTPGLLPVGTAETAVSPDGKSMLAFEPERRREVVVLDAASGKEKLRLGKLQQTLKAVAFSPDGTRVAAATGFTGSSGGYGAPFGPRGPEIGGLDPARPRGPGPGGSDRGGLGGFDRGGQPDDNVAAPTEVVIWDAASGKELARLSDKETSRNYRTVLFSPDGSFLAVQDVNGRITIWGRPPKPEPVKPAVGKAPAAPAAGVPERFQSLIRELSADGVSDQRRVESMFLAALGRLPTDTEARALTAQLARETDKAAGLRDLLNSLVDTAEFKTHAAALQQLVK